MRMTSECNALMSQAYAVSIGEEKVGEKRKNRLAHNSRLQRPLVVVALLRKNMTGRKEKKDEGKKLD